MNTDMSREEVNQELINRLAYGPERGAEVAKAERDSKADKAPRKPIGTLKSNGKTLTVKIDLRKLREGYTTFDAGLALIRLGKELANGFDIILTPEAQAEVY